MAKYFRLLFQIRISIRAVMASMAPLDHEDRALAKQSGNAVKIPYLILLSSVSWYQMSRSGIAINKAMAKALFLQEIQVLVLNLTILQRKPMFL